MRFVCFWLFSSGSRSLGRGCSWRKCRDTNRSILQNEDENCFWKQWTDSSWREWTEVGSISRYICRSCSLSKVGEQASLISKLWILADCMEHWKHIWTNLMLWRWCLSGTHMSEKGISTAGWFCMLSPRFPCSPTINSPSADLKTLLRGWFEKWLNVQGFTTFLVCWGFRSSTCSAVRYLWALQPYFPCWWTGVLRNSSVLPWCRSLQSKLTGLDLLMSKCPYYCVWLKAHITDWVRF